MAGKPKGLPKTGGRKKGTPNKITGELGERMGSFIENNFDKFEKMMEMVVDPEKYCAFFLKALEFKLPKRAAVNVTGEVKQSDLRSELAEMAEKED